MTISALDFAAVAWEEHSQRIIICLTLKQHWSLDHVRAAWVKVDALLDDHTNLAGMIVYCENPCWLPSNFNQIIAELTTEQHPNISHLVFVGRPLFEIAFWAAVKSTGGLPAHVIFAETINDARELLLRPASQSHRETSEYAR
jgi:hypothetical protein